MQILNSFNNRIAIVAFIVGFVAGIYLLIFFPAKYFIAWHELPIPPEPVREIISADHTGDIVIRTESDKEFTCNIYHEERCWTEIDYEPLVFGTILCFREDCPDSQTTQMVKATGQLHNFGELSFIYSLRDDGVIYVKHSGFVYLPGYLMGAILGGCCAFFAFVGKYLFLGIISLIRRGAIKQ